MIQYQMFIIGFGKVGKMLVVILVKMGWCVVIIEQFVSMFGGICINIGCILMKMLVYDVECEGDFFVVM